MDKSNLLYDKSTELEIILELWNNFGSHFEGVHDSKTAEHFWRETNLLIEKFIESDPISASEAGIRFATLPKVDNEDNAREYLRGIGLTILMNTRITPYLVGLFSSLSEEAFSVSYVLSESLRRFLTEPNIRDMDRKTAFGTPSFYSFMTALLVIMEIENSLKNYPEERINNLGYLFVFAKNFLKDPSIVRRISWYNEIEDTEVLAKRLLSYTTMS